MKVLRLWQSRSRTRTCLWDGAIHADKMKALQIIGILCTIMLYVVYRTTVFQHHHAKMEERLHPFDTVEEYHETSTNVDFLPRGIVHSSSDMELKPLWMTRDAKLKENVQNVQSHQNLLAIPAGIKQMQNVDAIVKKRTSQLFYSTMMARSTSGMISSGAIRQYMCLLVIRLNGGLPSVFCTQMLCTFMIIYFFGMKIWE